MANSTIGRAEKIIFRKFTRSEIEGLQLTPELVRSEWLEGEIELGNPNPTAVTLPINPYNVTFTTGREIQKTQSISRGRYVIQDWGPDLTVVKMQCQTGNILPYTTSASLFRVSEPPSSIEATAGISGLSGGEIANGLSLQGKKVEYYNGVKQLSVDIPVPQVKNFDTIMAANAEGPLNGYTSLILKSSKFQSFLRLFVLYNEFDANNEVLFMTFSRGIFRGYMTNFTFSVTAESPWNWKYDIEFVIIQGLSSFFTGTDTVDMKQLLAARNGDYDTALGPFNDPLGEAPAQAKRQQTREFAVIDRVQRSRFEDAYNVKFTDLGFTGFLGAIFQSPQNSPYSVIDDFFS